MAVLLQSLMFKLEIHVPIHNLFPLDTSVGPAVMTRQTIIGIVVFGLQSTMEWTMKMAQVARYAYVNIIVGVLIVVEGQDSFPLPLLLLLHLFKSLLITTIIGGN